MLSLWWLSIITIAPYRFDTPLSFAPLRRRPCVWYVGREATSDRLIASAERPVTIIPLTIGLSVTGKKPVSANRLPVPKKINGFNIPNPDHAHLGDSQASQD